VKLLVLDFDGVISDSAREFFSVALRTWAELEPRSRLLALDREALYADFLALVPLGNRAEDFGTALALLDAKAPVPDQAAYDVFRDAQDPAWRKRFHERFYRQRAALAQEDPEGWRALMPPYPELLDVLRRRAGDVRLAVATAKDGASVRALLRDYGVADLFPEECVLDKETGVHKTTHLEELQHRLGVPFAETSFLDDKVNHLDRAAVLGVRCALAAWGYNGPREVELARAHGHLVCRLEDVEAQLFAPLAGRSRTS
jgi:phosphoglycolate phosphatase-like HAD superfamily hydrolase